MKPSKTPLINKLRRLHAKRRRETLSVFFRACNKRNNKSL